MSLQEARWIDIPTMEDVRGKLTAAEVGQEIPFPIERVFYVHGVPSGIDRGGHAHRDTDQVAVCVSGSMKIDLFDGAATRTFVLDSPGRGVFIPRMLFTRLYDFGPHAVCLVLANERYDRSKSIRSRQDYLRARGLSDPGIR